MGIPYALRPTAEDVVAGLEEQLESLRDERRRLCCAIRRDLEENEEAYVRLKTASADFERETDDDAILRTALDGVARSERALIQSLNRAKEVCGIISVMKIRRR
jgi:hypothetical protein